MDWKNIIIEGIGWLSTATFLLSIVLPNRVRLHQWGVFTSVTTGIYAYAHGATAIWVKWLIAFFFHLYMIAKLGFAADQRKAPLLGWRAPHPLNKSDDEGQNSDLPAVACPTTHTTHPTI